MYHVLDKFVMLGTTDGLRGLDIAQSLGSEDCIGEGRYRDPLQGSGIKIYIKILQLYLYSVRLV